MSNSVTGLTVERVTLLPCPFCGAGFKIAQEPHDNGLVAGMFYIYHDYGPLGSAARQCPIDVPKHFDSEAEAIAAWNTRISASSGIIPREPTTEMIEAGEEFYPLARGTESRRMSPNPEDVWRAMYDAAPSSGMEEIVGALAELADVFARDGEGVSERFDRLAGMFHRDTGYLAPGKDAPMGGLDQPDRDTLFSLYDEWCAAKVKRARAALARIRGRGTDV